MYNTLDGSNDESYSTASQRSARYMSYIPVRVTPTHEDMCARVRRLMHVICFVVQGSSTRILHPPLAEQLVHARVALRILLQHLRNRHLKVFLADILPSLS